MTQPASEWRALARLAAPIALAQVGQMMLGIVDIVILGHVGKTELAAASAGHGLAILVSLLGMGIAMGLDPIVNQRLGAGDVHGAWRALSDGLRLVLIAVVPSFALLGILEWATLRPNLGPHILPVWLPMEREVASQAIEYAWARAPGIIPFMLFGAYRTWFYANHMTRTMIVVTIVANVANAVFNYLFVYGDPGIVSLGLPAIGLQPGGVVESGTVTSSINVLTICILAPIAFKRRAAVLAAPGVAPAPAPESRASGIRRIVRLGVPVAILIALEAGIFVLVGWRTGAFGRTAQGAQEVAIRIASFTFMVSLGVGAAATVRVGAAIGMGSTPSARRSGFTAIIMSVTWMAFCAVVLLLFPQRLAGLFSDDADVIAAAVPLLRMAGIFQVFDGTQASISGALRGAGDTRIPMLANLLGYWIIGLPIAEFLAFHAGMGPIGLWVGLTVALVVVAVLLTWRFHRLTRRHVERVA